MRAIYEGMSLGRAYRAALTGTAMLASLPCLADDKPPCNGDASACQILQITQHGTDPDSGAHVVIGFVDNPGVQKQAIYMELYLAKRKSDCPNKATMTNANVTESASGARSIDGYLCRLKATWERR
jgi:hypothetical protein